MNTIKTFWTDWTVIMPYASTGLKIFSKKADLNLMSFRCSRLFFRNTEGMDAYSIYNQIRAFSRPFFGAYFYSEGTKVKVFRAKTEKWQGYFGEPGEIIKNDENGAEIACGSGTITLSEVEINNQTYYNYIPL